MSYFHSKTTTSTSI